MLEKHGKGMTTDLMHFMLMHFMGTGHGVIFDNKSDTIGLSPLGRAEPRVTKFKFNLPKLPVSDGGCGRLMVEKSGAGLGKVSKKEEATCQ